MIQLREPGVEPIASEATRRWESTEVHLVWIDGTRQIVKPDQTGLARFPSPHIGSLFGVHARRVGPHREPIFWRVVKQPKRKPLPVGGRADVDLAARLRNSVWVPGSLLLDDKKSKPGDPVLRDKVIEKLRGRVDDISLVDTITIDVGKPGGVVYHKAFARGFKTDRERDLYCERLITACHPDIQVLAGYEITAHRKENTPEGDELVRFLKSASDRQIKDHAQAIFDFLFVTRRLEFDGVGFDLEVVGLGPFAKQIGLLYGTLANLLARDNRILAYASLGFTRDGVTGKETKHMASQPFALARSARNIIARPMGYDGTEGRHPEIIACALDKGEGKAGLHPSQLQMGVKIHPDVGISGFLPPDEVRRRCEKLYRRHRVGLIGFGLTLTTPKSQPVDVLAGVLTYEDALNPTQVQGPHTHGAPLQVPLGLEDVFPTS